jgi:hypothetical protein
MALAVTHVILIIVLLDIFRHYVFGKNKFPRYFLIIGGIAGIIPDIDIPLTWLINFFPQTTINIHGLFTHSLLFPVLFLIVGAALHYKKKTKWAGIFYVISAGWFFHLILDCLFYGPILDSPLKNFFWPLPFFNFCPQWGIYQYAASIDALILIIWLVHEEIHKKIKDYI